MSTLTIEYVRAMAAMVGRLAPSFESMRVGSYKYLPRQIRQERPRDPRVAPPPPTLGGIKITVDRNLPPYMAVLIGPSRGLFETPRMMIVDLRHHPRTDDMQQMLDDLVKSGAAKP